MYQLLIAEDNPIICRGIAASIDPSLPVQVTAMVHDGLEAKDVISKRKIDIIISDIRMPNCSGLELADWVHDNHPDILMIILTSYDEFDYVRHALKTGCIDFILKPTDPEELNTAIRKAITTHSAQLTSHQPGNVNRLLYDCIFEKPLISPVPEELLISYYCVASVKWNHNPETFPEKWLYPNLVLYNMPESSYTNIIVRFFQPLEPDSCAETVITQINSIAMHYNTSVKAAGIGRISSFKDLSRSRKTAQDALFYGLFFRPDLQYVSEIPDIPTPEMSHELRRENSDFRYAFNTGDEKKIVRLIHQNMHHFLQLSPGYKTCRSICNHYLSLAASLTSIPYNETVTRNFSTRGWYLGQDSLESIEQQLIHHIQEKLSSVGLNHSNGQMFISSVREFILEHYDAQLSLQGLAELFKISPNYLATQYKSYTGKTIVNEIIDARLKHAAGLLETTNQSIPEIASLLGYQSTEYFFRVFKKRFNMTPGQYRALHITEENK